LLRDLRKSNYVEHLFLFSSSTKNKLPEKSDSNFFVNFSSEQDLIDYADNYFAFLSELQQFFGREIDLVTEKSLRTPILIQEINKTKVPVYDITRYIPELKKEIRNLRN